LLANQTRFAAQQIFQPPPAPVFPSPQGSPAQPNPQPVQQPEQPKTDNQPPGALHIVPEQIIISRRELQTAESQHLTPVRASPQGTSLPGVPQPPSITVTIGRIEIKANTPAVLPKRAAPAPASLSLDEYLRQRQGGSR